MEKLNRSYILIFIDLILCLLTTTFLLENLLKKIILFLIKKATI